MSSTQFYSRLPIHNHSLSALLGDRNCFTSVPTDWYVIVTDIKNSTQAFENGRHEEVNLIATGSIISTLNLAQKTDTEIPFFFGGDGATLIVPPELHKPALQALVTHRENTLRNAGLDLRVGSVSVEALNTEGHSLFISRLLLSDLYSIPIVLGNGLAVAERIIKSQSDHKKVQAQNNSLDLTGMECRWDRIRPAMDQPEVVSLLITAIHADQQATIYKQIFDEIDIIFGSFENRNPVTTPSLTLSTNYKKLALETRTKHGHPKVSETAKNWLLTAYGKWFYMKRKQGQKYMKELVQLTDTLVIDGRINTVIAGTKTQRVQLQSMLDSLEQEGLIVYGIYTSSESIMSCYVQDHKAKHIHFVDGSDGGYTMAAKMLKAKIRRQETKARKDV